jgi:hypothetical protein
VTPIPEKLLRRRLTAGRVSPPEIANKIESRLAAALGPGKRVAMLDGRDMNLYFMPGVYQQLAATPKLLDEVIRTIESSPGVRRAYRAEQLKNPEPSSDTWLPAASLSYVEGRSGDIVIALQPRWIASSDATTHGVATSDDQRVPILFMGAGIKPGRYDDDATPADIAPTLAKLCGVTLSHAEGRPLTQALR